MAKDDSKKTSGEYEVGYCKPPTEHQFSSTNQPKDSGGFAKGYTHVKRSLVKKLQELAEEHGVENGLDLIADQLIAMCFNKKYNNRNITFNQRLEAFRMLFNRLEGKPGTKVEITEGKVIANLRWIATEDDIPFMNQEGASEEIDDAILDE